MNGNQDRRRVLVAAAPVERTLLVALFAHDALQNWDTLEADSFERARFILQHDDCDVLLIDQGLYQLADSAGLAWLIRQRTPAVFLTDASLEALTEAIADGIDQWLPRSFVLYHPPLLSAVLQQALRLGGLRRRLDTSAKSLQECRRQVSRLVELLWEISPADARDHWFTQRHMMERLQEEVARSERYGSPLSLVLGELQPTPKKEDATQTPAWITWASGQLSRTKRRSDVAGQYGPHGFMLLLTHTPETEAVRCCRRLKTHLESSSLQTSQPAASVQTYFGIASYSSSLSSPKSLLRRAEECLERAKSQNCDCVIV